MDLSISTEQADGIVRVVSRGTILAPDFATYGSANPWLSLLGPDWTKARICIDMADTNHIDSSAIGWLISSVRQLRGGGGLLAIHSIQPHVRKVLDMLRIGKIVPLAETEAEALALLKA